MSSLVINSLKNPAGSKERTVSDLIDGSAKAWVQFTMVTTTTILKSYNVASVVDQGVGRFTVNFTTPAPDVNYSIVSNVAYPGALVGIPHIPAGWAPATTKLTTGFDGSTYRSNFTEADMSDVGIAVYY